MSKDEEVTHPAVSSKAASILDLCFNSPTSVGLKQSRGRFIYKRPLVMHCVVYKSGHQY